MGFLSSIGKFFFGGSKKSSSSKTSGETTSAPWAPVIPSVENYLASTNALYGPGGAPQFSPTELQG